MTTIQVTEMLDITAPAEGVEIEIRNDGKTIWVNVDGICRLRVCQVPALMIVDNRGTT
jgi:hypothetical protein